VYQKLPNDQKQNLGVPPECRKNVCSELPVNRPLNLEVYSAKLKKKKIVALNFEE
jgi:hypothetical protein